MIAAREESSEFTLLTKSTCRPVDVWSARDIIAAAGLRFDWERFLSLVERHRVGPLSYDGLATVRELVPDTVHDELRIIARRDRLGALTGTSVLALAIERLSSAGIEAVSIKGPTLAMLAFGDASMRQFKDIDILIDRDDASRAIETLAAEGFRLLTPKGADDPGRLRSWSWLMKDVSLVHAASGTLVELHWRLNQNPHLLGSAIERTRCAVMLGSQQVDTLAPCELLLYLCVHGAEHFWFRLKWLADVAALLGTLTHAEIAAFYHDARSRGLGAPAGQMLLVIERVYALSIPEDVRAVAMRSWRVRMLIRFALRALHRLDEPEATRFATTALAIGHMLLRSSPRYIGREILDLLIDWPVALALSRSKWGIPIAIAGRPVFWLIRKVKPNRWRHA